MVHTNGFVGKRKVKDRWEDGGFIVESQSHPGMPRNVVPTRMEETPKAALDIHCLRRGGGVALTQTIN